MTLIKEWASFVADLANTEPYIFSGSQAIYPNVEWRFDASLLLEDEGMQLTNIGFTPTKIKQLTRHYINQPTIDRAKRDLDDRLENRKYGSGVWDFRGETKKTTKQDYCITSGVIAYYPPHRHTRIFINYRTVELIFRYRADLLFLRDVVLPQFDLESMPPDTITFRFVNCTIHPMFYIMLLVHLPDFEDHLNFMVLTNPRMYREVTRWTHIHLTGRYRKYATAARVQKFISTFPASVLRPIKRYVKEAVK